MYGQHVEVDSITNVFGQEIKVGSPILYFGNCTAVARVGRLLRVLEYSYERNGERQVYGRFPIVESAGQAVKFIYDDVTRKGHYEPRGMYRWTRQLSAANVFPLTPSMLHDTGEKEGYRYYENTAKVAKFLKLFD